RHWLGVLEALREDEVHLHPAAAAVLNRPQHARVAGRARLVGEDVVDLVAAAAGLEASHVGPLAVAVLELGLRLRLELLAVAVLLLGEAEVDERAVPGVPEGHSGRCFACLAETPFVYKLPPCRPIRPHFK